MAGKRRKQLYTTSQLNDVRRVLRSRNYYTVLDIGSSASTDDVKRSYKSLALQIHPDKNSAPDSEKAFKILGEAYETLKDPEKRHVYNFQLECALAKPVILVSTSKLKYRQYTFNTEPHVFTTKYSDVVNDDDDLKDDDKTSNKMPEFTYYNTRYTPKTTWSKFKTKCVEFLGQFIVILVFLGIYYYGLMGSPATSAPSEPPECNIGRFCLLKTRVFTARMLTKETETVFYVRPTYQPRGKRELEQLWADVEFAVNKRPYKHII